MNYIFYFNNKKIHFLYYYCKLFNEEGINNFEENDDNQILKITERYNIYKFIYITNKNQFLNELEKFQNQIYITDYYKELKKNDKHQFVNSLIEFGAYSYCLSRLNNYVYLIKLDFIKSNVDILITKVLQNFLPDNYLNNIRDIYKEIFLNYNIKNTGLFLYTDFELNSFLINLVLKNIFFKEYLGIKFLVYKDYIFLFNKKENIDIVFNKFKNKLLNYEINAKIVKIFNLENEDLLFSNNVVLENYSGLIKPESIEFIKKQLEKKIYQKISLSSYSEILLIKNITSSEFNMLKNTINKFKIEYLEKIKFYFDINYGNLY